MPQVVASGEGEVGPNSASYETPGQREGLEDAWGRRRRKAWLTCGVLLAGLLGVVALAALYYTGVIWRHLAVSPDVGANVEMAENSASVGEPGLERSNALPVPPDRAALRGRVISAVDNRTVADAVVQITATSKSLQTGADGAFYLADLSPGERFIEVAAPGFVAEQFTCDLPAGRETYRPLVLSPELTKDQLRFVVTWGKEPTDLDAHLDGPLPGGERFHVYCHQPGDATRRQQVRLDTDSRSGYGPETISVKNALPGTYHLLVHDYSNRDDPQSNALADGGAIARVYCNGQVYRFRPDPGQSGNVWDVCTVEVSDSRATVREEGSLRGVKVETLGWYDKRTQADRARWIVKYGGNAATEKAVADGLAWLARHQANDGFWSSECLADGQWSKCEPQHACTGAGRKYEIAQTGLALLAFQAGGHYYFNNSTYCDRVRKGLDWLVSQQRPDGALVSEKPRGGHSRYHTFYMYDHGIATFALADACATALALGETPDPRYRRACERAVRYIESQQHEDGGWRYTDDFDRPSDTSVAGWQVLALKSAQEAAIQIDYQCLEKIRDFFTHTEMGVDGRTWYQIRGPVRRQQTEATTAIGMLARQFLLDQPDAPLVQQAALYLADLAQANGNDRVAENRTDEYKLRYNYYLWYKGSLAMFQVGGQLWQRWNDPVRSAILALQCHDGCQRGSWDPDTQWGDRGGRIYTTALAILTLETYYRYTPQRERTGVIEFDVLVPDASNEGTSRLKLDVLEDDADKVPTRDDSTAPRAE